MDRPEYVEETIWTKYMNPDLIAEEADIHAQEWREAHAADMDAVKAAVAAATPEVEAEPAAREALVEATVQALVAEARERFVSEWQGQRLKGEANDVDGSKFVQVDRIVVTSEGKKELVGHSSGAWQEGMFEEVGNGSWAVCPSSVVGNLAGEVVTAALWPEEEEAPHGLGMLTTHLIRLESKGGLYQNPLFHWDGTEFVVPAS